VSHILVAPLSSIWSSVYLFKIVAQNIAPFFSKTEAIQENCGNIYFRKTKNSHRMKYPLTVQFDGSSFTV
ncbi:hypothetical protein BU185_16280, partial [Enterococcus faecium]